MILQLRCCHAVRLGRLAKSLIKRCKRIYLSAQHCLCMLRFLPCIIELDLGRSELRIENLIVSDRARAPWSGRYRPVFAGVFGLVHGAGFANYLTALFVDEIAVPLLGFNIGIELGQLVVLSAVMGLLFGIDSVIAAMRMPVARWSVLRVRVIAVSLVVVAVGGAWAVQRSPWG